MTEPPGGPRRRRRAPRTATSWTVAREAGVSQSTVSRALRGDPRVRPETRLRVQEAAERLGYGGASGFPGRPARIVGVVVPDLTDPASAHLLAPLHDELQLLGYRTALVAERTDLPAGQESLARQLDRSLDGVLVTTPALGPHLEAVLRQRDRPLVLMNPGAGGADVDRARADDHEGGRLAALHLLELGHRRIGLIRGPAAAATGRDQFAGFRAALAEHGVEVPDALVRAGPHSHDNGYQFGREFLRLDRPPTAVFCADDVTAFGVLDAARSLRVQVPAALSVLGFGDLPMAAWGAFQLTTVRRPVAEVARTAARMLVERIEHGDAAGPGRERVLATSLVRRSSTGPV